MGICDTTLCETYGEDMGYACLCFMFYYYFESYLNEKHLWLVWEFG